MTNRPSEGRGYITWTVLNFEGPVHISEMAVARALQILYIERLSSLAKGWQIMLKGAWLWSRAISDVGK